MRIDLSLQVWSHLDTGFVVSLRTKCVYFSRQKTWNLGSGCKIVSNHQHICRCECSHANSLHVICLFSLLSGFTFHTLSSLGVLGTGDLKWLRAERNLREIQLTLCASPSELQLLYSCVVQRRERERKREIGRCWEREKKREKKEQERERAGSPGFLSHPLRHPVLSLTHRPTFYLTYLAPAFNIIRHSVCFYFNARDMMYMICRYRWLTVAVLSPQWHVSITKQERSHMTFSCWALSYILQIWLCFCFHAEACIQM